MRSVYLFLHQNRDFEIHGAEELTMKNARSITEEIERSFDANVYALNCELITRLGNRVEVEYENN